MAAARREGVSIQCVLCLRRFRGFAPKYPTTFEKVDETFVFLHSFRILALPPHRRIFSCEIHENMVKYGK